MSRLMLGLVGAIWCCSASMAQVGPADPARMSRTVRDLTTDTLQGRAPAGPGEARTLRYLIDRLKALGLAAAGENGGWTQSVPMVRTQVEKTPTLRISSAGALLQYSQGGDLYVTTGQIADHVSVTASPLVFVGYGVYDPDRGRDDFKGIDLQGKTAVFLIGPPNLAAPGTAGRAPPTQFTRWTYKFDEAARRGAAAALLIFEEPDAAIAWSTAVGPAGEAYQLPPDKGSGPGLALKGLIRHDRALELFHSAGLDLDSLKRVANDPGFRPVSIGDARFSADTQVSHRLLTTHNVLAKRVGTSRPDETVMFAAHWDAFGPALESGKPIIRRGANDDAAGVAAVLEIARAVASRPASQRMVVFALWSAEERGLLGSEYYARHPIFPLEKTAANITFDILNTAGPSRDVVLIGPGMNSLEQDLAQAAALQHRTVTPESHPETGHYYRADHFSLARRGVPSLAMMAIADPPNLVAGGRDAGERWMQAYVADCYHKACDVWTPAWNLVGAAEDVDLAYAVGTAIADSSHWPSWSADGEFAGIRARSSASRR
jgi:Zn-dependent M28 family amino/carboxypeptidase